MNNVTEEDVLNALNAHMKGGYTLVKFAMCFNVLNVDHIALFDSLWRTTDLLFFDESDDVHSIFDSVNFILIHEHDHECSYYKFAAHNSWLASLSGCTSLEEIMLRLSVIE